MGYGLDAIGQRVRFSVLVSTTSAELDGPGRDRIVGKRSGSKAWVNRARSLTEEFLNSGDDAQSILHFTKKYGPLQESSGRDQFQFDIAEWKKDHARLRGWWEMFAEYATRYKKPPIPSTVVGVTSLDRFRVDKTGLTYECSNILKYMVLEIAAFPPERLRKCHRDGCKHRFVAHDLREKYCSEFCKTGEQNKAKLRYWNNNKQRLLAERMKKRKAVRGKNNVTRKAR
jgi:hypothetical protein